MFTLGAPHGPHTSSQQPRPGRARATPARLAASAPPAPGRPPSWPSRGYRPRFAGRWPQQFVTFMLADALPRKALARLEAGLAAVPEVERAALRRKRLHALLDAGGGSCRLADPRQALIVERALRQGDGERYRLLAWVVMPNHVHVLVEPQPGWPLGRIVHAWKSLTAPALTRLAGPLPDAAGGRRCWHRERWDRLVSDAQHYRQALDYIHLDPVKAGLAATPAEWRWSSAAGAALHAAGDPARR
jgi:REP element-mobilizing transposase RayT